MRHGKKVNHLGRTSAHRKAMLSNMAASLILHKRINTTLAKAKALRVYVEPLITRSKEDTTHSRRMVFSYLQNKEAVIALFREVSVKVANRPGGYTRILKTGNRLGDNAELCMVELVDFNENMLAAKEAPKVKTTRRGKTSKTKTGAVAGEPIEAKVETKATDEVTEEPTTEDSAETKE
ncbi:MAG: 50S ribosomal protein L17 [Lentimicrobium sp.]|nr:50S ribosomal protein L17 [Lentimicrobium sp.]